MGVSSTNSTCLGFHGGGLGCSAAGHRAAATLRVELVLGGRLKRALEPDFSTTHFAQTCPGEEEHE